MRRKVLLFTFLVIMVLCLGCGKKNEKNNNESNNIDLNKKAKVTDIKMDSSKMKDDFVFMSENYNIVLASGEGGDTNFFDFYMISKEKIDENKIIGKLDTTIPHNVYFEEQTDKMIKLNTFQSYNDMDWNELYKLSKEKDTKQYDDYKNMFEKEYDALNSTCDFYYYNIHINIDLQKVMEDTNITQLKVQYNGKEFVVPINVKVYKELPGTIKSKYEFEIETDGDSGEEIIYPNKDGIININNLNITADKDIKITDIKLSESENIEIKDIDISILGDNAIQQKWSGAMDISKGTEIKIGLSVIDNNFKSKLAYETKIHPIITYEYNGVEKTCIFECTYRTIVPADEAYAQYVDGIDIVSYYTDYYSKVN